MTNHILTNLLLAVVYVFLTSHLSVAGFAIGLAIGWGVLQLSSLSDGGMFAPGSYNRRLWGLITFTVYYTRLLIRSNFIMAWEILTPSYRMTPRIIKYNIKGLTDVQTTALTTAITITPGTLVCGIDDRNTHLFIHCMYAKDRDAAVADIDQLRRRLLREVFGR